MSLLIHNKDAKLIFYFFFTITKNKFNLFQEMLDLLASLNHANEMASKLKKRSEDILDTLDAEIKEFQKKPILN